MSLPKSSMLTPRDGEYATCAETYAELRIYPGACSADEISKFLDLEPTRLQEKGASIRNSRGRVRKAARAGWFLSSESHVDSNDLRDHLDWLLMKLTGAARNLRSLQEQDNIKMTISCTWWSAAGHGGPVLWPEQMETLAKLNLECSFDIYFSDDD